MSSKARTRSGRSRVADIPNGENKTQKPFPLKRLGQHFLIDTRVVDRIISSLAPRLDETIIEIGPGQGVLTEKLLPQVGSLIAVELDRRLVPYLEDRFAGSKNFKLIQNDALTVDLCATIKPASQARVVANLPYNISTAIILRLIEQRACLNEMVVMLQREVVDRMTAPHGSSDRGYFSVVIEAYCETETLFDVAPSAFRPPPKVWSSVARLRFIQPKFDSSEEDLLWSIVSAGFAQKRKTIFNNLRNATPKLQQRLQAHGGASIVLCQAEVDLQRRAETLSLHEWLKIARIVR